MLMGLIAAYGAFVGLLVWAAIGDVLHYRIRNDLVLALAACFVVAALALQPGIPWLGHLAAGASVLVAGFVLFQLGWIGGGDAKLWAAVALWSGLDVLPVQALFIAMAGGIMSLAILGLRRAVNQWRPWWAVSVLRSQAPIPYGVAIAAGALLSAHHLPLFTPLPRLVGWS